MKDFDIISQRLQNQGLSHPDFKTPEEVVAHFGAIQAQDFDGGIWSIGQRMKQAKADDIVSAFDAGRILRTHVMRPTWHFVMPEDIRWMLKLAAPQVKKILSPYDHGLEIDEEFLARCSKIIGRALESGGNLTRLELEKHLITEGITAHGQRLGHIMVYMELDGLVCSGPRKGKQQTYVLLEESVPKTASLTREQSLAKLAWKYFFSHGPAQLKDFSWWSGLSMKEATAGLEYVKSDLQTAKVGEKTYFFKPGENAIEGTSTSAFLLSIFDEFIIAYRDRTDLSEGRQRDIETMLSMGNAFTSVLVLNGRVAGTWKRVLEKGHAEIKTRPFRPISLAERDSIRSAAERYGTFGNLKIDLIIDRDRITPGVK